jgi:hypothetical protein
MPTTKRQPLAPMTTIQRLGALAAEPARGRTAVAGRWPRMISWTRHLHCWWRGVAEWRHVGGGVFRCLQCGHRVDR